MTQHEILQEIERLPLDERLEIVEKIVHNVRGQNGHSTTPKKAIRGVPVEKSLGIAKPKVDPNAIDRLHGSLQWDGTPPNDEEVKQILMDRLMEKYG